MSYKVFLSAPTAASLKQTTPEGTFVWRTAAFSPEELHASRDKVEGATSLRSRPNEEISKETSAEEYEPQDCLLPPATFSAASQRISEMYRNVIFPEEDDDEVEHDLTACEETIGGESGWEDRSGVASKEESLISWPPTNPEKTRSRTSLSRSLTRSQLESRDDSDETSYAHTSTSSITAFPTFVINLHTLASLSELASIPVQEGKWTRRKVNLLVAILEVDGPDAVKIKRGPDAGKEVGVLRLVLGGEEGGICKLTAWREVADLWGGVFDAGEPDESTLENEGVKRGDIVYLQNILASPAQPDASAFQQGNTESHIILTASPNLGSQLHICYRALPTVASDRRFRPDLRLATSDPGLRKVANVARWLEAVIGLGH